MRPGEAVREVEDVHTVDQVAEDRVLDLPLLDEVRPQLHAAGVSENIQSPSRPSVPGATSQPWLKWQG